MPSESSTWSPPASTERRNSNSSDGSACSGYSKAPTPRPCCRASLLPTRCSSSRWGPLTWAPAPASSCDEQSSPSGQNQRASSDRKTGSRT
ncbi:unnamed protein product [Leptidea sinapis]|uniref:Uncharacterized protein n=1 Tax=Leptidea sinapis TaxID=189913 RepID=A0A5E4QQF7_9NEOP|nr:unnamed protein product [Leptidea sinapis]